MIEPSRCCSMLAGNRTHPSRPRCSACITHSTSLPVLSRRSISTGASSISIAILRRIAARGRDRCRSSSTAVATRALCSTDQLLHALVHAELDDLRWIVDAGLLIEQGDIDWSLFCREVELRRVVSWVMRALTTAEDLGGVAVPPDVFGRLARVSMSRWDRMVLRTQERPATRAALAARARRHLRSSHPGPHAGGPCESGGPVPRADQRGGPVASLARCADVALGALERRRARGVTRRSGQRRHPGVPG